ncbi:N-formylglutamate amidohydrolase [Roseibium salinum]|uniref:N-formylglutamate amidohydrolase n=1 Tax=Roseibium salinum TaxID=1604349 RepID=A0ABT3R899_9HYPH|nr:N-formylglutamate amidohydrolase [Roseibium sp. DSM 29163]MCX2725335.1 N-formylglutamate amidohydrolase [Roseibium sp. DSM 29163]
MTRPAAAAGEIFEPTEYIDGDFNSGILLLCDHARNTVPREYGNLGVPPEQFERHIGYDIGARAVTLELARRLNAPACLTTFSRLLIDPNRGDDDPTLIMRLSDGAVVPGNARADAGERARRIDLFHRPYHQLIERTLDAMIAEAAPPVIFSIHSFTPVWRGVPRPWHVTVLWDSDPRAVEPLLDGLRTQEGLIVGDNEPYDGALKNDTMYQHATQRGLAQALLELRQDLIADEAGAMEWAGRLEPVLRKIAGLPGCRQIRHFKSRCGGD